MTHPPDCQCSTYGCVLRRKGVQVALAATPSRHNRKPPRRTEPPAWNRGVVGEHRQGGGFMPYIDVHGEPIRNKQWASERRKLTAIRDATRAALPERGTRG